MATPATLRIATRKSALALCAGLVDEVKARLDARTPPPDGYNVGFNAGEAAGQTVPHLHVHIFGGRQMGLMLPR